MKWVMALTALVALTPVAAQEEQSEADRAATSAAWKAQDAGHYLEADAILHARAFDAAGKPRPGRIYDQWAELQGVMNNVPAPRVLPPGITIGRVDADDPGLARIATATPRDAIASIVERAKNTRVVILNEDHASPRDRAFALEVARALRPLGFDLLGADTFNNQSDQAKAAADMDKLAADGFARRFTGVYTRDPVFGDFVRQSLALGYRPVAYETTDHSREGDWRARIARREQNQADNIVRALNAHQTSKLFLYVGFSHASERPKQDDEDGGKPNRWMAARLKAMTGIDPLTIEQTLLNDSGFGHTGLYALVAGKLGNRPAILFDGATPLVLGQYRGLMDLQVAHPPLRRDGGRPAWLVVMGRTPTPIPSALLPTKGTRLVQAFIASEPDDAIPVDQVVVTAGEAPPMLMLPKVPVRYATQDAQLPAF